MNAGDFCLEENTSIKLLNGQVVSVKQLKDMFDNNEELWVYSTDENGDFKPGKVNDVWISGVSDKMVKVTLDNGKEIITTPNHKYMMRDGSYKEAQDLVEYDSLMPLYFSYSKGYENVKLNSKKTTQFHSVYKIVSNEVNIDKIEEAKLRTNEDIIQIHHKDFNKLNNYPCNLYPMGKMEHWMYHASLGGNNLEALQEGSKRFWSSSPKRFEAREKQKQAAREYQLNMWKNFTPEEKQNYINKTKHSIDKVKLSKSLKNVWERYSSQEREERLNNSNNFVINNPMLDKDFLQSEKMLQRNKKLSQSLKKFHSSTTSKERSELYGWSEGVRLTDTHKQNISKSISNYHKEHPEHFELYKDKILEGGNKGREIRRQNKLNSMTPEGRSIYLFTEKLNKINTQKFTPKEKNIIGHIKPILINIFKNNEDFTEDNYNKYRPLTNGPTLQRLNNIIGDWGTICDMYQLNYNHKVMKVEILEYVEPIPVYDISVEKYHNFYVDAGVMLHNCYRFAYQATVWGYKYGKPENRPAPIRNPDGFGALCKHLTAILSNKKWMQQITKTLMDWIEEHIDEVNDFLKLKDDKRLTLPNELARQNAKLRWQNKDKEQEPDEDNNEDNEEQNLEDVDTVDNDVDNTNNEEELEDVDNQE